MAAVDLPHSNIQTEDDAPSSRVEHTRQRLLLAAAQVFAEQGYAGATTRGIAEAANLSELTLFRHFGSKKNLFMQVIQQFSALPKIEQALANLLTGEPRYDLQIIGTKFLRTVSEKRAAILMTLSEAERLPELRQASMVIPQKQRALLAKYLRGQIESGKIRPYDPELMAQAFLGMLFAYAINQNFQENPPNNNPNIETTTAFFVDIFLSGVQQPEQEARS